MRTITLLIHTVAWLALAALTVSSWTFSDRVTRTATASYSVPGQQDVVYQTAAGQRIRLDIYWPPARATPSTSALRRPAIMAIHGGSWIGGSKRSFRPDARNKLVSDLTAAGYVVVAVDYRLARPGAPGYRPALEDLRSAVRWMRRNAEPLGIDPDQIFALGQSSGAHLAALLGTLPDPADEDGVSSRVRAVINFYGPSDLNRLAESRRRLSHDPIRILLGGEPNDISELAADASPINHISPDDAPMLILHGSDDSWIPLDQSRELAERLEQSSVLHQLVIVEGARHGFGVHVRTKPQRDLSPKIFDFLKDVGNARSR